MRLAGSNAKTFFHHSMATSGRPKDSAAWAMPLANSALSPEFARSLSYSAIARCASPDPRYRSPRSWCPPAGSGLAGFTERFERSQSFRPALFIPDRPWPNCKTPEDRGVFPRAQAIGLDAFVQVFHLINRFATRRRASKSSGCRRRYFSYSGTAYSPSPWDSYITARVIEQPIVQGPQIPRPFQIFKTFHVVTGPPLETRENQVHMGVDIVGTFGHNRQRFRFGGRQRGRGTKVGGLSRERDGRRRWGVVRTVQRYARPPRPKGMAKPGRCTTGIPPAQEKRSPESPRG
jgi:hypothetical protein